MLAQPLPPDSDYVEERTELRTHVSRTLAHRAETIVSDAVSVLAFAGMERVEPDDRAKIAHLILGLITESARDGEVDTRRPVIGELRAFAGDRDVTIRPLFGLVYVMERAALDELALDESFGATTEPWPSIAQIVRRASFDVLAGGFRHEHGEAVTRCSCDPVVLTEVRTHENPDPLQDAVACPISMLGIDVSQQVDIQQDHGE